MEQNDEQKIEIKSDIIEPSREVKVQEKENTKKNINPKFKIFIM